MSPLLLTEWRRQVSCLFRVHCAQIQPTSEQTPTRASIKHLKWHSTTSSIRWPLSHSIQMESCRKRRGIVGERLELCQSMRLLTFKDYINQSLMERSIRTQSSTPFYCEFSMTGLLVGGLPWQSSGPAGLGTAGQLVTQDAPEREPQRILGGHQSKGLKEKEGNSENPDLVAGAACCTCHHGSRFANLFSQMSTRHNHKRTGLNVIFDIFPKR